MKLYKLTDQAGKTRDATFWEVGTTRTLPTKENPSLYSADVFRAYRNPNLALLLNPIQANFKNPRLWEIEGKICVEDEGKVGCFGQTVTAGLPLPEWYKDGLIRKMVQVAFVVLCAEEYFKNKPTTEVAESAVEAAVEAAIRLIEAAIRLTEAAVEAAEAAAQLAEATAWMTKAAAWAARAAGKPLDFGALADQAVEMALTSKT